MALSGLAANTRSSTLGPLSAPVATSASSCIAIGWTDVIKEELDRGVIILVEPPLADPIIVF